MRKPASSGLKKIWRHRPGGLRNEKSLLVWDKFSAHLTEGITDALKATNTDVAVIPGGLTGIMQPLDVSLNKPFKGNLRNCWMKWMADEQFTLTAGGNMRAPPLQTQVQWVKECWDKVEFSVAIKSLKKCCISNAMDGTEDDILLQDDAVEVADPDDPAPVVAAVAPVDMGPATAADNEEPRSSNATSSATEDPLTMDHVDPYDDQLTAEEWQHVFHTYDDDNDGDDDDDEYATDNEL